MTVPVDFSVILLSSPFPSNPLSYLYFDLFVSTFMSYPCPAPSQRRFCHTGATTLLDDLSVTLCPLLATCLWYPCPAPSQQRFCHTGATTLLDDLSVTPCPLPGDLPVVPLL